MKDRGAVTPEVLERMTSALRHRGPDETGLYLDDRVGLGHARLSIIDLASGTQPIHNEDRTLWIVYNGEVYNFPELRRDLEARGHRFYTRTDTEVILHLYEERGAACTEALNGQFAFAVWDAPRGRLFLARDRVGIRPLYYMIHEGRFLFASEIKALFTVKGTPREIDPVAMDQVFTFWTTLPGRSAFRDVHELPPGYHLEVTRDGLSTHRYWTPPFRPPGEQLDLPWEEVRDRVRELLIDAVRIRLRADVPVGTYLSGGLDSSGVTALVLDRFDHDARTFGIRFEAEGYDEGEHQNHVAAFLEAHHEEILADNEGIGRSLGPVLWHCEKPLLRTAPAPLFLLSGLVRRKGLKVVLTGEGADEVFGGYNIFREAKVRRYWAKEPGSKRRAELIGRLYPYIFKDPRLKRLTQSFFARGLDRVDDPLFSHLIRWENTSRLKGFFSEDLRAATAGYDPIEEVRKGLPAGFTRWDDLARAQYLEMWIFLGNYLLSSQGDRVAMAHSVEIRLPYLDPRILEFMGSVPAKWKIRGLNEKFILKKTFEGILPAEITRREKHPYRAPIRESLMKGETGEALRELLSEGALRRSGLFEPSRVQRLVDKMAGEAVPSELNDMALVGIFTSQLLFHHFVEAFPSGPVRTLRPDLLVDRRSSTGSAAEGPALPRS